MGARILFVFGMWISAASNFGTLFLGWELTVIEKIASNVGAINVMVMAIGLGTLFPSRATQAEGA